MAAVKEVPFVSHLLSWSLSGCLLYSPQLTNWAPFSVTNYLHSTCGLQQRQRPGHCHPREALLLAVPGTLSLQSSPDTRSPPALTTERSGLRAGSLTRWKRGKLVGVHNTGRFHTKNNIDSQIALHIYKTWEHFPAVCLGAKHKYPPFFHIFSNCRGRRPHHGAGSLTQPTPAAFSSCPAQGPQSQVCGTEHCLNTRSYQHHF